MVGIKLTGLKQLMEKKLEKREKVIIVSRKIQSNSKKAIYEVHRGNNAAAKKLITTAIADIKKARKVHPTPELLTGSFKAATEEFAEASLFLAFSNNKMLPTHKQLEILPEVYLGALSDFTGELSRQAVLKGTKHDNKAVETIWKLIDHIHGELQQFDFPNSDLRRKYDAVKYNLKKAEQIMYDLSLK